MRRGIMKPSVARRTGSLLVPSPLAGGAAPGLPCTLNQADEAVRPDAISPDAISPDAISPDAISPDAIWPVREDAVGRTGPDGGTIETDRGIGGTGVLATPRAGERGIGGTGIGGTGIGGEQLAPAAVTRDPASTSGEPAMAAVRTSPRPAPDPIVNPAGSSSRHSIRGSR
jgi:hypothetical protein